jgi:hypothetical protein
MTVDTPGPAPFGPVDLTEGERRTVVLGDLNLEVERYSDEVRIRSWITGDAPDPDGWVRWAVETNERLRLVPATPDRLVVVSPEHAFHLPPRGTARIFMRLPLFLRVRVEAASGRDTVLADLPSMVLSDTWWGTLAEGELGYWVTTRARRALSDDLFVPHYAMSSLVLTNDSAESLPVERLAVRVRHLGLFHDGPRLWTGETLVRYESPSLGSEIRFTGMPPGVAGHARTLGPPRDPLAGGFHARTFQRLKSLSNLGF